MKTTLSLFLVAILPACTANTSSIGQQITCETDPGTGVILSCQPGGGDGGANTCTDIDEDGDGDPHDDMDDSDDDGDDHLSFDGGSGSSHDGEDADDDDDDDDGIGDDDDCDHHPGEDEDGDDADLPYDVRPALGSTTSPIADAFAQKGGQPTAVLSVTGATWRSAELAAGTPFVVTDADCSHAGNRDLGRDRVIVTWTTADGATHADHLDIRYCK